MAGFTTTSNGDWVFSFDDPQTKPELPDEPNMATNYLAGPGKWENYSDKIIYECDSLLRQFFESKKNDSHWSMPNPKYRRFTTGMMFEVLFGRKYDPKTDHQYGVRLARVMAYYSTKIIKEGSINGKRYKKSIYTLSMKRYFKCPPYSLKLRIEWLSDKGELPTFRNMKMPKDDLKIGHARNKKTNENMERRSERARQRYNELYRNRKEA